MRFSDMDAGLFFTYLVVMAGVTYLIRVVPFVMINKKITNPYVSAFLEYIPYTVLTAMTIPAIFYSTDSVITAASGFVIAIILAYFDKSLITVALSASLGVFVAQFILQTI